MINSWIYFTIPGRLPGGFDKVGKKLTAKVFRFLRNLYGVFLVVVGKIYDQAALTFVVNCCLLSFINLQRINKLLCF